MNVLAIIRAVLAWRPKLPALALPKLRLTPLVNAVEAIAGTAVEGVSAATCAAIRIETSKPRFALDAGLSVGGALAVLAVVFGLYLHGFHKGEAAQAAVAAGWQARATAAEALANDNADAAARLHKAEADLVAEVDRHAHDNLASDARYAQALDAARKATEAKVACPHPTGKAEAAPPGSAPMTRSLRDALGVLRKGEHQ